MRIHCLALVCSAAGILATSRCPAVMPDDHIAQVWALEDKYWSFVQHGDEDSYLALWHKDFIGWPCAFNAPHPVGKSTVGAWVGQIRDQKIRFTYAMQHEMTFEYTDGHVVGKDVRNKVTHTWMKVGSTWQIIGGMCAPLDPPAK